MFKIDRESQKYVRLQAMQEIIAVLILFKELTAFLR